MRIALIGGGSGGHFFPLIAVAEAVEDICKEKTLLEPELIYIGPPPFDPQALLEHDIIYVPSSAGKMRRYFSLMNILSFFLSAVGIVRSTLTLFRLYPDVVFSTGGFAAFPTLWGARILQIPVVIYDADSSPGRVSLWSAKFARWIAVAHPDAAQKIPAKLHYKMAHVGHPIRKEVAEPSKGAGHEFLHLDASVQTVFIMGGSQGARAINEVVLEALPQLVEQYNVIHQTGSAHIDETTDISSVALRDSAFSHRYRPFGLLNVLALRMAAGISTLVVARAGSGTIFEVASWGLPAILIPIPKDVSHDQTENAFSYARSGAAVVIEQQNLTPHVLVSEIQRIMNDAGLQDRMSSAARTFARPDAARKIATILLDIAVEHEPV